GTEPTAFRARRAEDLLPTLRQLQRTQPDAVLKWFERGQIWDSPEQAADDLKARRRQRPPVRGRDWPPGGAHRAPRAKYKLTRDEKRARFKRRRNFRRPDEPQPDGASGSVKRPNMGNKSARRPKRRVD